MINEKIRKKMINEKKRNENEDKARYCQKEKLREGERHKRTE